MSSRDPGAMNFVEFDPNGGCWLWSGALTHNGYGRLRVGSRAVRAHRFFYEQSCGRIPPDRQIDHLCRVRCCCNPAHLSVVTREENIRRGNAPHIVNASKTHCKRGHEFTPENTYRSTRGGRGCLACKRHHHNPITNAARRKGGQ